MALFKISKGLKANLPITKTEGYCWYTTDDSLFYIDYKDSNGTLQRKAINAKDAETLTGANLSTILSSSDIEIPTSKAVLDKLDEKVDKITGKGLSTNDYTTDEKNKLSNIEAGAQVNVIESIKANGATLAITNKIVTIPTPDYPVKSVNGESGEIVLNDVKYTSQDLTSQQKSQARTNIGAGTSNVMVTLKTWTSSDVG